MVAGRDQDVVKSRRAELGWACPKQLGAVSEVTTGGRQDQPQQDCNRGSGGSEQAEDGTVGCQALRLAGLGDAQGVRSQKLREWIHALGLFGDGEKWLLEFREAPFEA